MDTFFIYIAIPMCGLVFLAERGLATTAERLAPVATAAVTARAAAFRAPASFTRTVITAGTWTPVAILRHFNPHTAAIVFHFLESFGYFCQLIVFYFKEGINAFQINTANFVAT
jgi:hypothetical protein